MDRSRTHQVNRRGVDDLDRGHLCDISRLIAFQNASSLKLATLLEYPRLWAKAQWRSGLQSHLTTASLGSPGSSVYSFLHALWQVTIKLRGAVISDPRINERIRVSEVRLVGPTGEQVGVVGIEQALRMAQEADLDLVEVAPGSTPPVCKIMDYGKFKYEAAQKVRESRKNQVNTILKTVRFGLKIDDHDYQTKVNQVQKFLRAGDKVKVMVVFRGREQSRPEMGVKLLQRLSEHVAEFGTVESTPSIDGRNMVMVIGPLRNKAEARAEAKKSQAKGAAQAIEEN
jgi:translation initiation factor IF-3